MEQMSIFENQIERPLAERLRPKNLEEYAGQSHLLGKGKILRRLIEGDNISSMIFSSSLCCFPVFTFTILQSMNCPFINIRCHFVQFLQLIPS